MKLTLLHTGTMSPAPIAEALAAEGVEALIVRAPADLVVGESTTAFVLDPPARSHFTTPSLRRFVESGGAVVALGEIGRAHV